LRIPVLDWIVDKTFESKPRKTKYFIELPLHIKKGERATTIDIPCTTTIGNFTLTFPSGIKYVYGETHEEDKTKEVKFKSCPSITVALPDTADQDVIIPLKVGFNVNPKSGIIISSIFTSTFLLVAVAFALCGTGGLILSAIFATIGLVTLRITQRSYRFWKTIKIRKEA
jgi:hypothetical protein